MLRMTTAVVALALPVLALPAGAFAQTSTAAKIAMHLEKLHHELAITPAEEPEWAQFAKVMTANKVAMDQAIMARNAQAANMNAADNMDSFAHIAQLKASNLQRLAAAFQSLYNSFPARQKAIADKFFWNSRPGVDRLTALD
jgi:periplasmic protein CpxP/Spy